VVLQELVEFVARRNLQKLTELMAGQPLHSVRVDGERFERRTGQILTPSPSCATTSSGRSSQIRILSSIGQRAIRRA
jgi:hypothetical protein